ncbi:hypothetical protein [Bacillus thuringiensis]|uniref:hypothetical protein n=1 Tax=Bacillus thuringiensis TaxID=1428 RepID=UPI000BFE62CF|nr:hypothetical protein [Bacillus thuringiensis]PGM50860.1 hypothetical protein CN949_16345 [Bacillus thuringiensis]
MKQVDLRVGDKLIKGCNVLCGEDIDLRTKGGVQTIGANEEDIQIPIEIHATVSLQEFNNLVARGVIS